MAKTKPDDRALLRAYLLGQLESDAADRVEDRFAIDAGYFDMYLDVERELVAEYAAGQMDTGDAVSFHRCYLVTPERRRQVAIVRAIDEVQTERQSVRAATYYRTGWLVSSVATTALVAIALYWNYKRTDGRDAPGSSQAASSAVKPAGTEATGRYADVERVPVASPPFGPVPAGVSGDRGRAPNSGMTATDFAALLRDRPKAPDLDAPLSFAAVEPTDNAATPSLRTLREGAEALYALYEKLDKASTTGIGTLVDPGHCEIQRVYELIDRANAALGLWLKAELSYWDAVANEAGRTPANPESASKTQAALNAEMAAVQQRKEAIAAYGTAMQAFYAKIRGAATQVCSGSSAAASTHATAASGPFR